MATIMTAHMANSIQKSWPLQGFEAPGGIQASTSPPDIMASISIAMWSIQPHAPAVTAATAPSSVQRSAGGKAP